MDKKNEYIEQALNKDADLSESDYRDKCIQADKSTKVHGVEGRAPIGEALRHKRIQTNFYGTCLNVLLSALSELSQTNALLMELVGMKYASMPPAAKSQYEMLKKREEVTDHAGKRE